MSAKLRIVVGSDDAGFDYKESPQGGPGGQPGVDSVSDVGVDADGHTAYPTVAIAAAEARRRPARPTAPCWSAAPASAWRSRRTRSRASAPSPRTTASRSSAPC